MLKVCYNWVGIGGLFLFEGVLLAMLNIFSGEF